MLYYYIWLFAQIVLESFPISSSGHIVLLDLLLRKMNIFPTVINASTIDHLDLFKHVDVLEHFAHGATIIVIAVFFYSRWSFLLRNIKKCWPIIVKIVGLGIIADLCTSIFYILFKLYPVANYFPLSLGFLITALLLLSLKWCPVKNSGTFNWRSALILGVVQGCALLPGISRLGSTFVAARWIGIYPQKSFEISWLIVTPLLCAAFLNSLRLMIIDQQAAHLLTAPIIATMLIASIVAYCALRFVSGLAYNNRWWLFGIYMGAVFCVSLMCAHYY